MGGTKKKERKEYIESLSNDLAFLSPLDHSFKVIIIKVG